MAIQTTNAVPAATSDVPLRCLVGIELSKKSWVVAVSTPLADKISRYSIKGHDWQGLLQLLDRITTRVCRQLKRSVEVISCYEAGYDGFWLHRLLESRGIRNHIIDPASLG
jgi:transposase